jgi:hypothetical protein
MLPNLAVTLINPQIGPDAKVEAKGRVAEALTLPFPTSSPLLAEVSQQEGTTSHAKF